MKPRAKQEDEVMPLQAPTMFTLADVNYSVACKRFYIVRKDPDPYAGLWRFVSRADVEAVRSREQQQARARASELVQQLAVSSFFAGIVEHRLARENATEKINRSLRAGEVPGALLLEVARGMPVMHPVVARKLRSVAAAESTVGYHWQ